MKKLTTPHHAKQAKLVNNLLAEDIIRTIKPLNGQNNMGVEDIIKTVKKAPKRCLNPDLLLHFILEGKITHQTKNTLDIHLSIISTNSMTHYVPI